MLSVSFDTVLSPDYLLNQINCASSAPSMMNYAAAVFWVVAVEMSLSPYSDGLPVNLMLLSPIKQKSGICTMKTMDNSCYRGYRTHQNRSSLVNNSWHQLFLHWAFMNVTQKSWENLKKNQLLKYDDWVRALRLNTRWKVTLLKSYFTNLNINYK